MATDRMWLIKQSEPEVRILIAKHLDGTWYTFHENLPEKLDAMFDDDVPFVTDWMIEYESKT